MPEVRSFDRTSDSVGTGNFTFNEDVSEYLRTGDNFYVIIHFAQTVVWNEGEDEKEDLYIEQCEASYLGNGVFSRGAIRMSSNENARVDFPAGTKIVDAKISASQSLRNAQGVLISNSSIGINVASASMGLHIEKDDAQVLQYDTSGAISDLRPAWLTGPSGANWLVASTNNTATPIPNAITRLTLTPTGDLTISGNTLALNVYATNIIATSSIQLGGTSINAIAYIVGNVVVAQNSLNIGNTTVNAVVNSTSILVGNSTINTKQYGPGVIVTHAGLFDPSSNDNAAFQTVNASFGGGIVLTDGPKRGGIWTNESGNAMCFAAGGLSTGFPAGSSGDMRIQGIGGVVIGGPTGSYKGAGTLNAVSVYDDNVLLTCMALSEKFLNTGKIDVKEWDKKAPRLHESARLFANMLEAGFDPRNPKQYIEKLKADHALPGMPTEAEWSHNTLSSGEMINRLWLAMEMLALTVMELQKKLEEKTSG